MGEFDSQWNISSRTGNFGTYQSAPALLAWLCDVPDKSTEVAVRDEIEVVNSQAQSLAHRLHDLPSHFVGLEILRSFVLDLLGRRTPGNVTLLRRLCRTMTEHEKDMLSIFPCPSFSLSHHAHYLIIKHVS
jgi:hypothetical protein